MRAAGTALYLVHVRALCFVELGHSFVRDVTCSTRVRSRYTRGCADESNLALRCGPQRFFNFPRSVNPVFRHRFTSLPEIASELPQKLTVQRDVPSTRIARFFPLESRLRFIVCSLVD